MKRLILSAVLAILLGLPLGWIAAMAATPLLWRLEPVLKIELAGHSGPSDWVFYVVWACIIPTLFLFLRRVAFPNRAKSL
jgi:ABC-type antimicrobial peptide transport system permease subunit